MESSSVTPPSVPFPRAQQLQSDIGYQYISYHSRSEVGNPCERQFSSLQKHSILSKNELCAFGLDFPESDDKMKTTSTVDLEVRAVSPLSPSSSTICHHDMFNVSYAGGGQYFSEDCVQFPRFSDRVNSSKPGEVFSCTKNVLGQNPSHPFQMEMRRDGLKPEDGVRAASGVNTHCHGNICSTSYARVDEAEHQWHGYQHEGDWFRQRQRNQEHGVNQYVPRRTHKQNYQPNGSENWAPPRSSTWDPRHEHGIHTFRNGAFSANQHCFIDGEPRVLIRQTQLVHQHVEMIPRCPPFQQHCQKLDGRIHSVGMPRQPPLNFFYGEEVCDKNRLVPQANDGHAQPVDKMSMYFAPYVAVECERV